MTLKTQARTETVNGSTSNLKSSGYQGTHSIEWRRNLWNGRKYLQTMQLISGLYSEFIIWRIPRTQQGKKKKIKKRAKDLNKHFSKEDTQMANSKKQRSMSLIIQQIQNQEIMASHTLGWLLLKREKITRVGETVEKLKPLWTAGGKIK